MKQNILERTTYVKWPLKHPLNVYEYISFRTGDVNFSCLIFVCHELKVSLPLELMYCPRNNEPE